MVSREPIGRAKGILYLRERKFEIRSRQLFKRLIGRFSAGG
jgi:hypothetical protein